MKPATLPSVAQASTHEVLLEMLKEVVPSVVRVAILYSPKTLSSHGLYVRALEAAAPSVAITPVTTPANDAAEIKLAIDAFAREPNGGLIVLPDATPVVNRGLIVALAARDRLPAVYPFGFFARDGGLMSYGVDADDRFRQSASYIDRILKGAKPPELPVQLAVGAANFNAGAAGTNDPSGFIGGLQIGYNWQFTNFVLGFEGDVNGLTGKTTRTFIYPGPAPAAGDAFRTSAESSLSTELCFTQPADSQLAPSRLRTSR